MRKTGLLRSRLTSNRRLKLSVIICPDDIFWAAKHFVTKRGMVTQQQNEPECHVKQKLFAVFKVKVTARAHVIKIWLWLLYLLNCWFFMATKLGLMMGYYRPERLVEKLDHCIQGRGHSEGSKCRCLSRWNILNRQTFCYQTWYCDASSWAGVLCKKIRLLFSRSWSQQGLV